MRIYSQAVAILFVMVTTPGSRAVAQSTAACPYTAGTDAIEYELPPSVLSFAASELQLQFKGLHHRVTRQDLSSTTARPKITVTSYSGDAAPSIDYDAMTGRVTIVAAGCGTGNEEGSSATKCASTNAASWWTAAASSVLALTNDKMRPAAGVLAGAAALGGAQAHDGSCKASVEVVVEAPAAYTGVRETCLAEVKDKNQCPAVFPTFATCDDPAPTCAVAVIGAGVGGLYTAMRLVDEGRVQSSDVCIFEATERVGGRLFSLRGLGPNDDLTVDAGGYRTWPEFTPTAHALITEYLNITMGCYDPSEQPCGKFTIVNDQGGKIGFATFVEEMARRLIDGGACFYPHHELEMLQKINMAEAVKTEKQTSSSDTMATQLSFTNGVVATATYTTILAIPQRPLMNIVRNSNLDTTGLLNAENLDALHSVQTVIATKLYLYYPKGSVFWRKLGLLAGDYEYDGDARNMLLAGRYHDGHVECDDAQDLDTCHGFLLAVYANDLSGNKAQFFRRYQRNRPEPVTILSNSDLEGSAFLEHAHGRLQEFHLYDNPSANYTTFEAQQVFVETELPQFAVLSTWNEAIPWAGGAWHAWLELDNMELAMQPFANDNLYVVNEAYSLLHGWAEGAVKLGDTVLQDHFGIERPWSFNVSDFNQEVAQTNSQECAAANSTETGTSGGSTSGGSSSGGSSGGENVLCFTGDALVEMADGSFKRIAEVQKGDVVATGTGLGDGIVSEALYHYLGRTVPVAVIATKQGDVVGTPDHPVLEDGVWLEAARLTKESVTLAERYIDGFYNLEIDGHAMEESSHSYVVNGIVASGLGDSEKLNRLFARQYAWKVAAAR